MDIEEDALPDGLIDDGREISDDVTEIDMPEIVDSDSSDDEDPEVLHKKYGYGWQDIRDKRRTRIFDKEEGQQIAVGEMVVADEVRCGLCRNADDGTRTVEYDDEDAARASSKRKPLPAPRARQGVNGSQSESTQVIPLVPPMMRMNVSERKRLTKARVKERREMARKAAIEYKELARLEHRGYVAFHP